MPTQNPKTCFVIMPFGEKETVDGKTIDFDDVYKYFIKPTVESLGLTCIRCDEIEGAGWVHRKMFESIYAADVAFVDITSLNPNVFYELGVRHAVADSVTVLLRRKGTEIPFNIKGFQVIEYDKDSFESVEKARKKIAESIQTGLKSNKKDSPVHEVLDLKIGKAPKRITDQERKEYELRGSEKKIGIVTGDIRNVQGIDVWVNSENTNMQMARHLDCSISATIRYYGAKRSAGRIVEDTIAEELLKVVGKDANVPAGEVIVTGAGELERRNGVKKVFHAASVTGQPCEGYRTIEDVGVCVRNALEKFDDDELKDVELKSILVPLMGTGTARGQLEPNARRLIEVAISYLVSHPKSRVEQVYFLTWSEQEREVCEHILEGAPQVVKS